MKVKVKINIFKGNGTYYTSGEYEEDSGLEMYEIHDRFKDMAKNGRIPGLIDNRHGYILNCDLGDEIAWIVYMEVRGHRNNFPKVFLLYYSQNSFAEKLDRLRKLKDRLFLRPRMDLEPGLIYYNQTDK